MSASAVEANMASGMHVFISRALQKILREAPKKHAAGLPGQSRAKGV